jgi:16S rRNA (cytidine1402-2'-O)-methyltransferase
MSHLAHNVGMLYLVSTPIGHLDDITYRAIQTLKEVDVILAEDTRHASQLLQKFSIHTPCVSFHAHNENIFYGDIILRLKKGENMALVSDAGTPLISDPGYPLVFHAKKEGISVVPIPGPSALITALSASGLPTQPFTFLGFLPVKPKAKTALLATYLSRFDETLIMYESTHRLMNTLTVIQQVFGDNIVICLAKELTKSYETILTQPIHLVMAWLAQDSRRLKGEFVIIIDKRPPVERDFLPLLNALLPHLPLSLAVKIVATFSNAHKKVIYDAALIISNRLSE